MNFVNSSGFNKMNILIISIVFYPIFFLPAVICNLNVTEVIKEKLNGDVLKIVKGFNKGILAIGETSSSIMAITPDFYVLTWHKSELNKKTKTLPVRSVNYEPLEKRFPKFASNLLFQKIKNNIHTGYINSYNDSEEINLPLNNLKTADEKGIRYSISNDLFIPIRTFDENNNDALNVLTKYNTPEFYSFTQEGTDMTSPFFKYLQVSAWTTEKDAIDGRLCKDGQNLYFAKPAFQSTLMCKEDLNWAEKRGFITDGYVLLFNSTAVTIFSEGVLDSLRKNNSHEDYPFEEKPLEDFFVNSVNWLIIGLAILGVVLLIVCLGAFCMCRNRESSGNPSSPKT